MAITRGSEEDLPDILALLRQSALPAAGIEQHLDATLVARDGAKLLGCAAVEIYGSAGLLRSVAVASDARGAGLGQELTLAALELARRRGVSKSTCSQRPPTNSSRDLGSPRF